MKPECVLDEEGIIQRFQYSRSKNFSHNDSNEETNSDNFSQSLSPIPQVQINTDNSSQSLSPPSIPQEPSHSSPVSTESLENPETIRQLEPERPFIRVSVIQVNPVKKKISPAPFENNHDHPVTRIENVSPLSSDNNSVDHRVSPCTSSMSTGNNMDFLQVDLKEEDLSVSESEFYASEEFDESTHKGTFDGLVNTYLHKKFRKDQTTKPRLEIDALEILAELNAEYDYNTNETPLQLYNSLSSSNFHNMELESLFVNDMESTFMTAFREINLGEQVMNGYIDFCIKRHDLDPVFFTAANLQFRLVTLASSKTFM